MSIYYSSAGCRDSGVVRTDRPEQSRPPPATQPYLSVEEPPVVLVSMLEEEEEEIPIMSTQSLRAGRQQLRPLVPSKCTQNVYRGNLSSLR